MKIQYFERLSRTQTPEFLWIGCADSRVPANEIVGLGPGELFVHRNIANLAAPLDANVQSALQYAVEAPKVKHIIVCGHYGCGGVLAALREWSGLPLEKWLAYVRAVRQSEVAKVVWRQDRPVVVYGRIYDLRENLLHDLDLN